MPSLRRHIITGEPIVFAPERAGRPNAFGDEHGGVCPFCPGNEELTPPELERVGDPWRIRVFPNKYPSVAGHEVIVESPEHVNNLADLSYAPDIVETYVRRYVAHRAAQSVAIFTNHGRRAGASIDHPHSQVMPLSFIPPRIAREIAAFTNAAPSCPLCIGIDAHRRDGLIIEDGTEFVRMAPYGSSYAYEQWVVPRRHVPEISDLNAEEVAALGEALQQATRAAGSVSASQNLIFMNFRGAPAAHFYAMVIPRLTVLAGFELGTGTFIDIMDPAAAARALR